MKITLEEIESVINHLATAVTYAKEARRVAKKVCGSDSEISADMKVAYREIEEARAIMEMRS